MKKITLKTTFKIFYFEGDFCYLSNLNIFIDYIFVKL